MIFVLIDWCVENVNIWRGSYDIMFIGYNVNGNKVEHKIH